MLPRRPACCRALQRPKQALSSTKSIWISNALLLSTFQCFLANSKGTRRHGSFVPGPLESRRRMGKRRMAYRADAGTPMFGSGEPWAWMGDIKDLSWRWKAPTSSATRAARTEIIPRWLALWPYPPNIPMSTELETAAGWLPKDATFGREKLLAFQQELSRTDADQHAICLKFNQYLMQSIKIGTVDEDVLYESLSIVTDAINSAFDDVALAVKRKLEFYHAIWGGILSCKVLPLVTFRATTMDHLLEHISTLPVSAKMRALARDILNTVSVSQLEGMNSSIQSLVNSWSLSWLAINNKLFSAQSCKALMSYATAAVEASHLALLNSKQELTKIWEVEGKIDVDYSRLVINELRKEINFAIKTVKKCEALFFPVRSSIMDLAHTLQNVAPSALNPIIESCTHNIIERYRNGRDILPSDETNIRISLLTLVSHLPNASQELFVQTWQAFDTQHWNWRVAEDIGCDFILSHMVSQGFIKDPAWLKNIFEASPDSPTLKDYGFLLVSLYKQEKDWSGPLYLFRLLLALNKHYSVYKAFGTAGHNGLKLPAEFIRPLLSSVALVNPRIAFSMYSLCVPHMYSKKHFDLSLCPDFVISMIHDDKIGPQRIWKALGIPIYENLRRGSRYRRVHRSPHQLSPTWIALLTEMATAFSVSKARPQRVAFRNVSQCLLHLRRHRIPISPEMSRALSYAGITREILRENWVSKERLHWILTIVAAVEGQHVRNTVEATVELWWKKMEQLSISTRHLRLVPAANAGSMKEEISPGKEMAMFAPIVDARQGTCLNEEASAEAQLTPHQDKSDSRHRNRLSQKPSPPAVRQRILQESKSALPKKRNEVHSKEVAKMVTYTPLAPTS